MNSAAINISAVEGICFGNDARHITPLQSVFEEYLNFLRVYAANHAEGAWAYRERTHVGIIAAASWKAGFLALEEWAAEKTREGGSGRGRCDLWIAQENIHIEAKHKWCNVPGSNRSSISISNTIKEAINNASHLNVEQSSGIPGHRLAFTFLAPIIEAHRDHIDPDHATKIWLEQLNEIEPENRIAVVWLLPGRKQPKLHGYHHPLGIVLVVHRV